jgi:DNA-binding response OmpR family regulator
MGAERILVVDDEAQVRRLLRECFEADGYEVVEADGADSLKHAMQANRFDLITLDIRLTDANGLDLISTIRAQTDVPIIMVTGQDDIIDKVVGLEKGADDFITKPFHVREVLARIRAVIRRTAAIEHQDKRQETSNKLHFAGWTLCPDSRELIGPDKQPSDLTTAEFKLLHALAQNPKRVLSRDRLMDLINGSDWSPLDRTIDNQIARLRRKIERDPKQPRLIKTVRGVGYSFASEVGRAE